MNLYSSLVNFFNSENLVPTAIPTQVSGSDMFFTDERNNTELHLAMKIEGMSNEMELMTNLDKIETLLNEKYDPNSQNLDGNTPLHLICDLFCHDWQNAYRQKVVTLLLNNGAQVNQVNNHGMTALHLLANSRADAKTIEIVLEHSADLNAQDNEGNTPLHLLAKKRNRHEQFFQTELAWLLRINGAEVNVQNHAGETPLHLFHAHFNFRAKDLKFFIKSGLHWNYCSLVNSLFNHGLNEKIYYKIQKKIKIEGVDFEIRDEKFINWVTNPKGKLSLYRMLTERNNLAEKDHLGNTLLHYAGNEGCDKIIAMVLKRGIGPNLKNRNRQTPIFEVVYRIMQSFKQKSSSNCVRFEQMLETLSNPPTPSKIMSLGKGKDKDFTCLEHLLKYQAKCTTVSKTGLNIFQYAFYLAKNQDDIYFKNGYNFQKKYIEDLHEKYREQCL